MYSSYQSSTLIKETAKPLSPSSGIVLLLAMHIPLALLMHQSSTIATLHAMATLAIGLFWALTSRQIERIAYVAAYITGAEVLWRMTEAGVVWETGKYGVVAIFLLALLRHRRLKVLPLPLWYFVLLLPSVLITLGALPLDEARQQISATLSGPFSLMVCVLFFSQVALTRPQLDKLFLTLIAPIVGITTIALYDIATNPSLTFTLSSNSSTSGGFGPNQVSSMLGAGVMLIFFYLLQGRSSSLLKIILFGLLLLFAAQSALTFSRGGLYLAAAGILVASFFLARDRAARIRIALISVLLLLISHYFVLPWLDSFTNGNLALRFQEESSTGRDLIARADLLIWRENLVYGVGPGRSNPLHAILYQESAAHTEFTRMLADHGLLGFGSMLILFGMTVIIFQRAQGSINRGVVAALLTWALLFMVINAMRLVIPSFLFGLAANRVFMESLAGTSTLPNQKEGKNLRVIV